MTLRRMPPPRACAPPGARVLLFAARHRAFVARFRRGTAVAAVGGVAQILRRAPSHVIERLRTFMRLCTRIVERRMTPIVAARAVPQAISSPGGEIHRHERRTLLTRLIERRTHSTERSQTNGVERRIGTGLPAAAAEQRTVRIVPPIRIEARRAFPPVARTPARIAAAPKASSERREAPPIVPRASERRAVTRFGGAIGTPEPLTLPPNELSRVTEHVIGELDRRVLSYRERMGKI